MRDRRALRSRLSESGWGLRDFAHLAVTLCRCLNIPARYANGFPGDIGVAPDPAPMNYNAWFKGVSRRAIVRFRCAAQRAPYRTHSCRSRPGCRRHRDDELIWPPSPRPIPRLDRRDRATEDLVQDPQSPKVKRPPPSYLPSTASAELVGTHHCRSRQRKVGSSPCAHFEVLWKGRRNANGSVKWLVRVCARGDRPPSRLVQLRA